MGDANASIPTPEPVAMRPMWAAASARSAGRCSVAFVSGSAAPPPLQSRQQALLF